MSENLKVEIEITPEIEVLINSYGTLGAEREVCYKGHKQLVEAINKAKNKIHVGDLVRSVGRNECLRKKTVEYFIYDSEELKEYNSLAKKASPEECKIILPLLGE